MLPPPGEYRKWPLFWNIDFIRVIYEEGSGILQQLNCENFFPNCFDNDELVIYRHAWNVSFRTAAH